MTTKTYVSFQGRQITDPRLLSFLDSANRSILGAEVGKELDQVAEAFLEDFSEEFMNPKYMWRYGTQPPVEKFHEWKVANCKSLGLYRFLHNRGHLEATAKLCKSGVYKAATTAFNDSLKAGSPDVTNPKEGVTAHEMMLCMKAIRELAPVKDAVMRLLDVYSSADDSLQEEIWDYLEDS